MQAHYDVAVIGGGTAGVVAALQAARAGMQTLLVEKTAKLGGTMTNGEICCPGLFDAWGKQVIAGIGWELVERCAKEGGTPLPDFSVVPEQHWVNQVRLNAPLYAMLCDEAVCDAGVDLYLHAMVAQVQESADDVCITLCTKSGLQTTSAKILIDCTGDANALALAGCALRIPDTVQPGTYSCHTAGYEHGALDFSSINAAATAMVSGKKLYPTDCGWNTANIQIEWFLRLSGCNANHIPHINAIDSEGKTKIEVEGRASLLRLFRFLHAQPGLEKLSFDMLAAECGVRETATIIGEETITAEDYSSGRHWPDALSYAFYPIDLHESTGGGLDKRSLSQGVVPTVPRGALIPQGRKRLLAAGRCLSSDRLANSALRVQATCMATGQAAGAMAALAVQNKTIPAQLPLQDVYALLIAHQAIVPEA